MGSEALPSRRWYVTAAEASDPIGPTIGPFAMPCPSSLSLRLVAMPSAGRCIAVTIQRKVELSAWNLCALVREA